MHEAIQHQLRHDCITAAERTPGLVDGLRGQTISVVGGLGFSGTWIAEMIAALNDEFGTGIHLHLIGREPQKWITQHARLRRGDISLQSVDIRSAFEFSRDTTLVIHAAGIADPRIHASDPQVVYQSTLFGLDNTLAATNRLENIQRFVLMSSGLVTGHTNRFSPLGETEVGMLEFRRLHNLYAEVRRAAEAIANSFASQFRLPVSTVRAFTFLGPYQPADAPWAINNFIRDALSGNEIRIHGAGSSLRSYLYGSDVAAWLLQSALRGKDGSVYNFGGTEAISHAQAAEWISERITPKPKILMRTHSKDDPRSNDFFPDVTFSERELGVQQTIDVRTAITRTLKWQANQQGLMRLFRDDNQNS